MAEQENVTQDIVQPADETQEAVQPEQQTQEPETQTPQESVAQEQEPQLDDQRVPYSRFKEKVDEVNWYKQQMAIAAQRPQPVQPTQPQQVDRYAGMDAETAQFYRNLDKWNEQTIDKKLKAVEAPYKQQITYLTSVISNLQAGQFMKDHPDVVKGSPEEQEIAGKIRMGYPLKDAYYSVMGERLVDKGVTKAKQQTKQNIQTKRQANVESSPGVSTSAQPKPTKTFREKFDENYDLWVQGKL